MPTFQVPDTLAAFRTLAGAWRRELSIPVAAVAGSVGKTTTKEFLAAALSARWRTLKTEASRNGDLGIAMTLCALRPGDEAAVVEIGIDAVGAMASHLDLVRPTAAVVTAVGAEHLERLHDLDTVAREESLALEYTERSGGLAAVNLDDPRLAPLFERLASGRTLGFTLEAGPDRKGVLRGRLAEPDRLEIEGRSFLRPLAGRHNASNLLAAIAVARGLGLSPDEIRKGLQSFRAAPGRTEIRRLPDGTTVLADHYNANPTSMRAALELLAALPAPGARWACLGDMLELGPDEERLHRELADPITAAGVSTVLLLGPRMESLADELRWSGYSGRVEHFERVEDLVAALTPGPADAVLVKGSRGMRMERVLAALEERGGKGR